jgi:hypothetical protein
MADHDSKSRARQGFGTFEAPAFLSDHLDDRPSRGLNDFIYAEIGATMRAHYADLLDQPIPDRFVELLEQIDRTHPDKAQ